MLLPDQSQSRANAAARDVILLKQAVAAHRAGNKAQARELLATAAEINPNNELVWLWRSSVAAGYREAVVSLERVLALNPNNAKAQQWMNKLRTARAEALRKAGLPPDADPTLSSPSSDDADLPRPTLVAPTAQPAPLRIPAEEEDDPLRRLLAEKSGERQAENRHSFSHVDDEPEEEVERGGNAFGDLEARLARPGPEHEAEDAAAAFEAEAQSALSSHDEEEEQSPQAEADSLHCPVCEAGWVEPQRVCMECRAITDLALVEDAPQHEGADRSALRNAEKRLIEQLDTAPTTEAYVSLALVYLNLRQSNDALEQLREALRQEPEDEAVRHAVLALEKRELILAVDDSKTIQRMIASVLEKERFRVAIAADGLQALARLDEEMPALILLDITMPRMDGYQVCKVVNGNDSTKHIPVIMLSGKDGFFDKVRGRMVGASNYITKPFDPPALLKAIRKQLPND